MTRQRRYRIWVLLVPVLVAAVTMVGTFFLPERKPEFVRHALSATRLKLLNLALMRYVEAFEGAAPARYRWAIGLQPSWRRDNRYPYPPTGERSEYAINRNVSGAAFAQIADPTTTPVFFESRRPGPLLELAI